MILILRIFAFLLGLLLVAGTVFSAVETFVLPRSAPDPLTRLVFQFIRRLLTPLLQRARSYRQQDRLLSFYAPFALLSLLPTWLALVLLGYTGMFWALDGGPLYPAFRASGSSLLTLGFESTPGLHRSLLAFSEATIGLILVALLIAYLPTMYAAFQRRETAVTLLEVRAGNPPSAIEMLLRYQRIHGLDQLNELWRSWEIWFADLQESHTSLSALVFFRSPEPHHSWVTAAGAVLDAASLTLAAVDRPFDAHAALCIRAGYLALRQIGDFFGIPHPEAPAYPVDPISITRQEFEAALDELSAGGIPLRADRDAAWQDFAGWRVNYDSLLVVLAALTFAPIAPWSSDRARDDVLQPYQRIPRRKQEIQRRTF